MKELKRTLAIIVILIAFFALGAFVQYHPAEQVYPGTFPQGNFVFNGSIDVYGSNNINLGFPDGLEGEAKNIIVNNTLNYTVPGNKTLYITTITISGDHLLFNSTRFFGSAGGGYYSLSSPLIAQSGTVITTAAAYAQLTGYER